MFTSHVLTNLTLTTNLSSLSRLGVTIIVGGRGGYQLLQGYDSSWQETLGYKGGVRQKASYCTPGLGGGVGMVLQIIICFRKNNIKVLKLQLHNFQEPEAWWKTLAKLLAL